jgi:hypothetical protein
MACDVNLLIFDPCNGVMVRVRWLGMSGVRDKAREVLGNAINSHVDGYEYWADVAPEDVITIAEASYKDGAHPAEVRQYAIEFPSPRYWWILEHDV